MRYVTIYTDIDTLFDTRRGTLEHVAKESGNKAFRWESYKAIYVNRTMDYFEHPDLGITHKAYTARFEKRSVDDWVDEEYCYYYPTNVLSAMLPIVRGVEIGSSNTMNLPSLDLTINTYPFEMSEHLKTQLIEHVKSFFKIKIEVKLVFIDFNHQTANLINAYNYVFRYGHLINKELIKWYETYPSCTQMGVKIIVPDLLAQAPKEDELLAAMNSDSIKSRIEKMSSIQGGKVIFIPFDKSIFDYCSDIVD